MNNIFNIDKLMNFFNYTFTFLILNLFFLLCNIPLLLFIIFIGISNISTYLPLFLILSIPIGPSFTTLIYCTGKLIRNKDINLISDIIRGFKINFKQSLLVWIVVSVLILVLYTNISFFSNYSTALTIIFYILSLLLILVTPYIFILISRFSMNLIDIVKISLVLTFTRPLITISNIFAFAFALVIFEISPGTSVLFIGSVSAYIISYCNKALLEELESNTMN